MPLKNLFIIRETSENREKTMEYFFGKPGTPEEEQTFKKHLNAFLDRWNKPYPQGNDLVPNCTTGDFALHNDAIIDMNPEFREEYLPIANALLVGDDTTADQWAAKMIKGFKNTSPIKQQIDNIPAQGSTPPAAKTYKN
jgi:hypothetical protein